MFSLPFTARGFLVRGIPLLVLFWVVASAWTYIPGVPEAAGFEKQSNSIDADLLGTLHPDEPASYLAWRRAPVSFGGRQPRPGAHTTLASTGEPCAGASASCRMALDSLAPERSTVLGPPPSFSWHAYLAVTRGDSVFAVTSPEEAARFLAPIDTAAEVVLLLTFEESPPAYVQAGPGDGFLALDDVSVSDCPLVYQTYLTRVFPSGRTAAIYGGLPFIIPFTCI